MVVTILKILGTQQTLNNRAFEIYVAGCNAKPHCPGCHNPESWSYDNGVEYTDEYSSELVEKIMLFGGMITNIWILGGEPMDQEPSDMLDLLISLHYTGRKIWMFTRYEFDKIPNKFKKYLDYIKTGSYNPDLKTDDKVVRGVKLATSNQDIWMKMKEGWQKADV